MAGRYRWFAAVVLLAVTPGTAAGGGFALPEMGVRRTAMAAEIGRPDEPSAVLHNPAGLILLGGTHLYVSMGLSLLRTQFRLHPWDQSDEFLGVGPEADGYYAPTRPDRAFAVLPMLVATTEVLPHRLVAGAALYVGNATGSRFPEDAVTRYHLIEGYVVAPVASLTAAYRIAPWLSAGLGLGLMNIRIHGRRDVFPVIGGADVSGFLGKDTELVIDGSAWVPTWTAGLYLEPVPRVTIGATVIGKSEATLSGPVEVNIGDDVGGGTMSGTQATRQLLPWTFMGGINVDALPFLEVGAELRYWLYRQYDEQRTDVDGILFVTQLVTPKNYRDSYEVSGGVRLHDIDPLPAGLELMLGWHYDRTPAPRDTVSLDQPTFSHVGLHSGLRYRRGRYRLGLSYIHYWYKVPTITGSVTMPPSNIRGSGGNNIITASFEATLGRLVGP